MTFGNSSQVTIFNGILHALVPLRGKQCVPQQLLLSRNGRDIHRACPALSDHNKSVSRTFLD